MPPSGPRSQHRDIVRSQRRVPAHSSELTAKIDQRETCRNLKSSLYLKNLTLGCPSAPSIAPSLGSDFAAGGCSHTHGQWGRRCLLLQVATRKWVLPAGRTIQTRAKRISMGQLGPFYPPVLYRHSSILPRCDTSLHGFAFLGTISTNRHPSIGLPTLALNSRIARDSGASRLDGGIVRCDQSLYRTSAQVGVQIRSDQPTSISINV
jgi:hypothetical protein